MTKNVATESLILKLTELFSTKGGPVSVSEYKMAFVTSVTKKTRQMSIKVAQK